jgi:hypothetical protein
MGNLDSRVWSKADSFFLVVSIPVVDRLAARVIHNRRILKQGDCKFTFIQAMLPDDEITIVKPLGCPFSALVNTGNFASPHILVSSMAVFYQANCLFILPFM